MKRQDNNKMMNQREAWTETLGKLFNRQAKRWATRVTIKTKECCIHWIDILGTNKIGYWASLVIQNVKNLPGFDPWVRRSPGEGNGNPSWYSCLENPMNRGAWWAIVHALEKEMATHSSVLAWKVPGVGEPGGLPSMGSHRLRHDWSDLAAAGII